MSPGRRYDDPRSTPEYVAKEKIRKRLVNREAWVKMWWPRIKTDMEGTAGMAKNEDGSVKDDGTLSGYYASRRENRLERQQQERETQQPRKESR